MPHGLTREAVGERLAKRGPVWCRPLAESNKSRKPMRLLRVSGNYAELEQMIAGRMRQVRVALEKLEYAKDPDEVKVQHEKKAEPAPAAPRLFTIAESKPPEPPPKEPPPPPAAPPEPPPFVAARREWKGPMRWVVMHGETHRFYTPAHKWDADIEKARQYPTEGGANKGAGRLRGPAGRSKGQPIVGLRMPDAYSKLDLLAKKAAEPPAPVAPAPSLAGLVEQEEREQIAADSPVASIDPTPPPKPPTDAIPELQRKLELAMRAEHEAFAAAMRLKIEAAAVQLEIDIVIARRRNLNL